MSAKNLIIIGVIFYQYTCQIHLPKIKIIQWTINLQITVPKKNAYQHRRLSWYQILPSKRVNSSKKKSWYHNGEIVRILWLA